MSNTGADIAISALDKLIDQELAAVRAASRDGNRPLYEISSTRYHAYLTAKEEIRKALAACVPERGRDIHLREQWHRSGAIRGQPAQDRALRHLRQVVEDLRRLAVPDHLGRSASLDDLAVLAQHLEDRP